LNAHKKFFLVIPFLLALNLPAHIALSQQVIHGTAGQHKAKRRGLNLVGYDNRKIHYGFYLALNYSTFRVAPSQTMVDNVKFRQANPDTSRYATPVIYGMNPVGSPSFTTGFIFNYRLHEYLDFRFNPGVSFYQRTMQFRYARPQGDSTITQLNQSTFSFMEFPIMLKYKSKRRHNTRLYMIGGIRPGIEVGAKRSEVDQRSLRVRTFDITFEYGFGFDFYYPFFKFSPEVRFSTGFMNMVNPDNNEFANSIKKMTTQTVTLYLNFE